MKVLALSMFLSCAAMATQAQVADVSVCDVVNHPKKFDGQMVRVKATVSVGFDSLIARGDTCDSSLWLAYPAGTKAKSGPAAVLTMQLAANSKAASSAAARTAVVLEKNADFLAFDLMLSTRPKTPGQCLGCVKNDVTATLVGRVDGSDDTGLTRDASGAVTALNGFGNLNGYGAQLVLQSVSGPVAQEVDFTKSPKVKDDGQGSNDKDYMKLARAASAAFPKGSDPAATIDRALAAYSAPGADNGVTVAFGQTAEVADQAKSARTSPDGVVYLVRFDTDRLKGDALSRAVAHEGSEIATEREHPVPGFFPAEAAAWQAVLLTTIGERGKTLTLPGGIVMWDETWAEADKAPKSSEALNTYLKTREESPR